jgi:hypothetical protein
LGETTGAFNEARQGIIAETDGETGGETGPIFFFGRDCFLDFSVVKNSRITLPLSDSAGVSTPHPVIRPVAAANVAKALAFLSAAENTCRVCFLGFTFTGAKMAASASSSSSSTLTSCGVAFGSGGGF